MNESLPGKVRNHICLAEANRANLSNLVQE